MGAAVGFVSVVFLLLAEFFVLGKGVLPPQLEALLNMSCDCFEWPLAVIERSSGLGRFHLPVTYRIITAVIFYPGVGALIGWCVGKVWRLPRKKKQ